MHTNRLSRIVAYALSRVEAYLIVVLVFGAVVAAILGGWPWWVIAAAVVVGALLLGLLVLDSLADPDSERDAALADVEVGRVRDRVLRDKLRRALEYVRAAQKLAHRDGSGVLDTADDELPQLEEAARSIYQMSLRLQEFRADSLLRQDLMELQRERQRRGRLTTDREAQLASLHRLEEVVSSAEREIDDALAHLGRAYAEMQAIKVTPELRGVAAESLEQLEASSRRLSDLAAGYDEAFGTRARPGGMERQG
jgi:hypothetical protein